MPLICISVLPKILISSECSRVFGAERYEYLLISIKSIAVCMSWRARTPNTFPSMPYFFLEVCQLVPRNITKKGYIHYVVMLMNLMNFCHFGGERL